KRTGKDKQNAFIHFQQSVKIESSDGIEVEMNQKSAGIDNQTTNLRWFKKIK
ncbi:1686_t:CDS:1, partial [Gigaspora rosea]